jgi:nitrite reductase (NADH) large subunit
VSERGQFRPATDEERERGEAVLVAGPTIPVRGAGA